MEFGEGEAPQSPEHKDKELASIGEVSLNGGSPLTVATSEDSPNLESKFSIIDKKTGKPFDPKKVYLYLTPLDSLHMPGSKRGVYDNPPRESKSLLGRLASAIKLKEPPIIGTEVILGKEPLRGAPLNTEGTDAELAKRIHEGWGLDNLTNEIDPVRVAGRWGWGLHIEHSVGDEDIASLGIRPDQLYEGDRSEFNKRRERETPPSSMGLDAVSSSNVIPGFVQYASPEGQVTINNWDTFEPPSKSTV